MQSRNFNSASLSAAGTPATNLCVAEPLVSRSKTGRCEWSHQSSPTRCDSLCMAPGRGPTMHFSRRRGAKRRATASNACGGRLQVLVGRQGSAELNRCPCPRCWNATLRTLPRRVVLFLQQHHRALPIESVSRGSLPRGAGTLHRNRRVRIFQVTLTRERVNAKPNQRVHTLMRTEDATQRRFPKSTPNHLPRAQPAKDVTPETRAIQADHAGTARSEL
jgi:hypothetical protein